jgi:AAA domain/DnaB-like helicase N terminal domain
VISNEQAVIAALLLDAAVLRSVVEQVDPGDFADGRLGELYRRIAYMPSERIPIDVITVSDRLGSWGVRGVTPGELHQWIAELPTAANGDWYAAAVHEAGMRRALSAIASRLVQQSTELDPGRALAGAMTDLGALRDSTQRGQTPLRTLGAVLADTDDSFDWVIDGLLERRDRLMLTGLEGHGKTTLLRQMAILAAAGLHPFTFKPLRAPVRVVFVDAENTEKQWVRASRTLGQRAATYGRGDPMTGLTLWCAKRLDLTRDADLGRLHKAIDEQQPDVLFLGPLYRMIPRAINSDDDAVPLLAALDTLRDRGLALVVEAHAGHMVGAQGSRELRPRGSSALLGWPEFGFGLRGDRNGRSDNDYELVRWRGDRELRDWPTKIAKNTSSGWPWTPTAPMGRGRVTDD